MPAQRVLLWALNFHFRRESFVTTALDLPGFIVPEYAAVFISPEKHSVIHVILQKEESIYKRLFAKTAKTKLWRMCEIARWAHEAPARDSKPSVFEIFVANTGTRIPFDDLIPLFVKLLPDDGASVYLGKPFVDGDVPDGAEVVERAPPTDTHFPKTKELVVYHCVGFFVSWEDDGSLQHGTPRNVIIVAQTLRE